MCTQLAKDSEALKAQVTSLLGELHEKQSCLEKSDEKRRELEEKYVSVCVCERENQTRDGEIHYMDRSISDA